MLISLISLHIGDEIEVNVGKAFLIPRSDSFTPCPSHCHQNAPQKREPEPCSHVADYICIFLIPFVRN